MFDYDFDTHQCLIINSFLKQGDPLKENYGAGITMRATQLILENITEDQAGLYRCVVEFEQGEISSEPYDLQIEEVDR